MKIVLVSLSDDLMALGVRSLSAFLKSHGHQVRLIFLRGHTLKTGFVYQYAPLILEQVAKLCENSVLIGISVYTNYLDRVVQMTTYLKSKLNTPVIWGNLHPTVRPEDSLKYADMICMGEGEEALVELADNLEIGNNTTAVKNIWFKEHGQIIKNPIRPLVQNLDSLPFCDFEFDDDYVFIGDKFIKMDRVGFAELLPTCFDRKHTLRTSFGILGSRGCPHACSYCGNNVRKKMYEGQCYLRFRSPENIVAEIDKRKKDFPNIQMISFIDDAFTAQPQNKIDEFCRLYKRRVNLPFHCFASPVTLNKEKMDRLVVAGLQHLGVGIQSGSDRMQKIYKRYIKADKALETAILLNKYTDRIAPPCYDIIVDNPYENIDDKIDTLKLLIKMPAPFHLSLFSLVFYPGTDINVQAQKDGLLKNEIEEVCRKSWGTVETNGYNFLLYLMSMNGNFRWVARLLSKRKFFIFINNKKLNIFWATMWRVATFSFLLKQGLLAFIRGDLHKKIAWVVKNKK